MLSRWVYVGSSRSPPYVVRFRVRLAVDRAMSYGATWATGRMMPMMRASRLYETIPLMAMTVFRPPKVSRSIRIRRSNRPDTTEYPVIRRTRNVVIP